MRAICTKTFIFHEIPDLSLASYAILSRHQPPQPSQSPQPPDRHYRGISPLPDVIITACSIAADLGADYLWDYTLCVDQSSSGEAALAVNESRQRLSRAIVTIVYLYDLASRSSHVGYSENDWERSGYWKEASTTTEFILSKRVEIYDNQWNRRCAKTCPEFMPIASSITGVPISVLREPAALANIAVGIRIAWYAAKRSARPEDAIYFLAPILGVEMPIMYGEGKIRAFCRLQEQFLLDSRDSSVFAWRACRNGPEIRGLFAHSPAEFSHLLAYQSIDLAPWTFDSKVRFTNRGAEVRGSVIKQGMFTFLDIKKRTSADAGSHVPVALQLQEFDGIYVRVGLTSSHAAIPAAPQRQSIDIIRDVDPIVAENMATHCQIYSQYISQFGQPPRETGSEMGQFPRVPLRPKKATGLKRSRSGMPLPPYASRRSLPRVYQGYYSSDSSESEAEDSCDETSSDSDDSSARSPRRTLSEYDLEEDYILEDGHKLHSIRPDILNSVYDTVQICLKTAEYQAPPEDRLPPLKRARTMNWDSVHGDMDSATAVEDPNLVIIPRQCGYFHLSCPYYLCKPEKYRACLLEHDLQSIEDVIHHLQEHHTEPPYCPICRQPFERALVRDNHVRARGCRASQTEVDGVNERQKRRLEKKDRIQLGEIRRWARIWHTVFPGSEDVPQPYLKSGVESDIAIVRDFWDASGANLVTEYLEKQGISRQHEPEEVTALSQLVLQDILNRVFKDQVTPTADST